MREWTTKDSGARQEFETGSVRDTREGKGRYDLIPPFALKRIAGVYERGAVKYGDRNWEKGQPIMRYYDSAIRHLNEWLEGKEDEDHLAQAAWNLLGMLFTEEMLDRGQYPESLDDKPNYNVDESYRLSPAYEALLAAIEAADPNGQLDLITEEPIRPRYYARSFSHADTGDETDARR